MRGYIFQKNKLLTTVMVVMTVLHTAAQAMVALMISWIIDTINEIIFTGDTSPIASIAILCVVFAVFVGIVVFSSMYLQGPLDKKDHAEAEKLFVPWHATPTYGYLSKL